jgi:hypothetical protein
MEQQNVYDLMDLNRQLNANIVAGPVNHNVLRGTSIATYFCPSRRSPPALTTSPAANNVSGCSVGDYAAVAYGLGQQTTSNNRIGWLSGNNPRSTPATTPAAISPTRANLPRTWDGAIVVCRAFNALSSPNSVPINGFQRGTLGGREFRSMTSFASVLDGLSNTAMIGEKAVHKDRLGRGGTSSVQDQDGPYYYYFGTGFQTNADRHREINAFMRRMCLFGSATAAPDAGRVIALKPTGDQNANNHPRFRFGSWHPGISLFLLGDGSVRQVNNATSTVTLERFGTRNDRFTFDLP